jgi:hypothetical protein
VAPGAHPGRGFIRTRLTQEIMDDSITGHTLVADGGRLAF